MIMQPRPDLLRETLSDGVYKTLDNRFYVGAATQRAGWVVQYLTDDNSYEHTKVYVDDFASAQVVVDQIVWAESVGARVTEPHIVEMVSAIIEAIDATDVRMRFKDKGLVAIVAVETVLRIQSRIAVGVMEDFQATRWTTILIRLELIADFLANGTHAGFDERLVAGR